MAAKTATSFESIFPSCINERMNLDMICLPDEKKIKEFHSPSSQLLPINFSVHIHRYVQVIRSSTQVPPLKQGFV